jgi:hypothetical protein
MQQPSNGRQASVSIEKGANYWMPEQRLKASRVWVSDSLALLLFWRMHKA